MPAVKEYHSALNHVFAAKGTDVSPCRDLSKLMRNVKRS